jgi:UDP-glucuronate decarboxylase
MNSNYSLPVNLGNPDEHTIVEFAHIVQDIIGVRHDLSYHPKPLDDPIRRRPDITRAIKYMDWTPKVPLRQGLKSTVEYFKRELNL